MVINILEEPSTRTWQLATKLDGVINDYVRRSRSLLILLSFTMFEEAKGESHIDDVKSAKFPIDSVIVICI